jgi:hypothetical protein
MHFSEETQMLDRSLKSLGFATMGAIALICAAPQARALECPPPVSPDQSGPLAETPDHLQAMTRLLSSSAALPDLANIVPQVRQWRPEASPAMLVNYMIALYCPIVRDNKSLSEAEKETKVRAFASQVTQYLY